MSGAAGSSPAAMQRRETKTKRGWHLHEITDFSQVKVGACMLAVSDDLPWSSEDGDSSRLTVYSRVDSISYLGIHI